MNGNELIRLQDDGMICRQRRGKTNDELISKNLKAKRKVEVLLSHA